MWEDEKKKFKKRETRLRKQIDKMNFLLSSMKTNRGRNVTVKTNFDGYDHANLSQIGSFLRLKFFPHNKFSNPVIYIYNKDQKSFSQRIIGHLDMPSYVDEEFYYTSKQLPLVNRKLQDIRSNINRYMKVQFLGKSLMMINLFNLFQLIFYNLKHCLLLLR